MLGFVFAQSRRQITPGQASSIVAGLHAARGNKPLPQLVGLFVNEPVTRLNAILGETGLNAAQLSGDESADVIPQIHATRLMKAVRISGDEYERPWLEPDTQPRVLLLVDAHVPGVYGGTGVIADWERAAMLARQRPIMLAGGLTPENVAEAIRQVRPWGVDVSSGVETAGVKDTAKIHAFIAAVRAVDQEQV